MTRSRASATFFVTLPLPKILIDEIGVPRVEPNTEPLCCNLKGAEGYFELCDKNVCNKDPRYAVPAAGLDDDDGDGDNGGQLPPRPPGLWQFWKGKPSIPVNPETKIYLNWNEVAKLAAARYKGWAAGPVADGEVYHPPAESTTNRLKPGCEISVHADCLDKTVVPGAFFPRLSSPQNHAYADMAVNYNALKSFS